MLLFAVPWLPGEQMSTTRTWMQPGCPLAIPFNRETHRLQLANTGHPVLGLPSFSEDLTHCTVVTAKPSPQEANIDERAFGHVEFAQLLPSVRKHDRHQPRDGSRRHNVLHAQVYRAQQHGLKHGKPELLPIEECGGP